MRKLLEYIGFKHTSIAFSGKEYPNFTVICRPSFFQTPGIFYREKLDKEREKLRQELRKEFITIIEKQHTHGYFRDWINKKKLLQDITNQ